METRVELAQSWFGLAKKNGVFSGKGARTAEDWGDFITFAPLSVKHAATHRSRLGEKKRNQAKNGKNQDKWCPQILLSTLAQRDQWFKCVETASWPKKRTVDTVRWDASTKLNWAYSEIVAIVVEEKRVHGPSPRSTIM